MIVSIRGTPTTLKEAIENGLADVRLNGKDQDHAHIIQMHVKDFLAQKFQTKMIMDSSNLLNELWTLVNSKS